MDLCNIKNIHALLAPHGFKFSRSMGQNFLTASWVPERIAEESGAGEGVGVLEIGPGVGCLTKELAMRVGKVVSVELDRRLIPVLRETVGEFENVTVINGDIMELDIGKTVEENFSGLSVIVCANLPYNITSPVLTKLIDSKAFDSLTVMIQREVAKRICARPGSADYGAFTLYAGYHTEPEMLFDVAPGCFEPQPKVTSTVIRMKMRAAPPVKCDEKLLFSVIRAAFNQRRKTLINGLSSAFSGRIEKDALTEAVRIAGFDEKVRGETLSLEEYARLTDEIGRRIK